MTLLAYLHICPSVQRGWPIECSLKSLQILVQFLWVLKFYYNLLYTVRVGFGSIVQVDFTNLLVCV